MWTFKGKEILAMQTVCGKHVDGYYSLSAKPGIASTDNENIHQVSISFILAAINSTISSAKVTALLAAWEV